MTTEIDMIKMVKGKTSDVQTVYTLPMQQCETGLFLYE